MIKFGVLGAAAITPRALIYPCMDEPGAIIRTIAARDRSRAEKVAEFAHIPEVVDDYQAVIDHPKCNAIYIPLPITAHHEWTLKALAAGKHVLCEKSIAANAAEATEMAAKARETGLVLMEAFHYRYHSVFIRAKEIFQSGELGEIKEIDARFCLKGPPQADDIRMQYATGGGATMDLGCYPISWVRHLMDAEPIEVSASAETGPPDVDLMLETEMRFANGVIARTRSDFRSTSDYAMNFRVVGDAGTLYVEQPLVPQNGHRIDITIGDSTRSEVCDRRPTYGYQLDAFIAAVERDEPMFTDAEDAVKQMQLIDRCYEAAGMRVRGLT